MGYEKRQFLYGMDFDTEERLIEQGFTRKNVNIRVGSSSTSGVFAAENIEGNVFIPNVELPTGDNEVIGSYQFKQKNLVYYFVYNSDGNHGIYEYNHVESKIKTVMIAEVLNFNPDYLITGINVVEFDIDNYFLYWTDNFNSPRKININKAKDNLYVTPITEDVIDAIKYPPLFPPTASYINDDSFSNNYLADQIWQFKATYVYDDSEVSAYSPISIQVLPNSSCLSDSQGNTIKIIIPKGGNLVERVKIAGRLGNLEDFKLLEDKKVSEYEIDANGDYVFYFRNDGIYNSVPLVESNKLFDNLPQLAKAQEYIEGNRITYANITEGFDNVDVDYDFTLDYDTVKENSKNTIKGYLRISQPRQGGDYASFQPIHNNGGSGIVYGGFNSSRYDADVGKDWKQHLPLGGFVVYLAGTDYYTITKQIIGNNGGIQSGTGNVYDSSTKSKRRKIRNEITGSYGGFYTQSRCWSDFEFNNIPDGTYILRVASNYTTQADLDSPSRDYQKTSTCINRIGFNPTLRFNRTNDQELSITVQGGQIVDRIEIVVADLSSPDLLDRNIAMSGYFVDPEDPSYAPTSIADALGKNRIEGAVLFGSDFSNLLVASCDHNGFFFEYKNGGNIEIGNVISGVNSDNDIKAYNYFDTGVPSLQSPSNGSNGTNFLGVYATTSTDITNFSRTNAVVQVQDQNGNPLKGVSIVTTKGTTGVTDSTGEASLTLYAPGNELVRTSDFIITNPSSVCDVEFNVTLLTFSEAISVTNKNDLTDPIEFQTVTATVSDISSQSRLKRGGVYEFGIVYYDRANRSGTTQVDLDKELLVPFYTEEVNGVIPPFSAPLVNWEIKSLAPSWATHYQWVRTKNTALDNYLQWYTDEVGYLDDSGNPSNSSDATILTLDITNLTSEYKSSNPDSILVYDFTVGDRVRFIKDSGFNYFNEYIDVKVLGFDAGVLKVENLSSLPDVSAGVMFEVYSPKLKEDDKLYYEIGECYEIGVFVDANNNEIRFHKGDIQDQDPLNPSSSPATGVFKSGDTYYRNRSINTQSGFYNTSIDSQLFSDFWNSKISDIGRPNIVDKDSKRVNRPTTIYYSDRFLPETNINGLNSFYDTSFETYDRKYGSIQKLYSQDKRLDCFQELKIGSIMVEEDVTFTPDGNPIISYSDKVLSKINYYKGEYGTLNPESFAENEGRRYIFDIRNGAVLRLSIDGITPISDKKLHDYFESKSNFYSAFDIIPKVLGVYDKNFDEYVISFGSVSRAEGFTPDDLALVSSQAQVVTEERNGLTYTFTIQYGANEQGVPTEFEIVRDLANGTYVITSTAGDISLDRQKILSIPPETLGFSEKTNHWTSFYTYYPEDMCRVGLDFLSFRNGQAYLHNYGDRNSFYGENSSSEVWVVFNQNPSNNKVFQALSQESTSVWEAYEIVTQNGQKTNLIVDDFRVPVGNPGDYLTSIENIHYAALWQDENTPNVSIPLLEGDSMRDVSIMVKLLNGSTEYERLFAVNMNYSLSARSNR